MAFSKANKMGRDGWGEPKRIEVITTYLALGNASLVAAITKVPSGTIRQWRTQPWWKEYQDMIQTEDDQELSAKLRKRIDKALDVVMDRLENGDFQINQQTGELVRVPVKMRDATQVAGQLFDKRSLIQKKQAQPSFNQEAVADVLAKLAKEFAEFANYKKTKVINAGDIREVSEQVETVGEIPILSLGYSNSESTEIREVT